jgi:hypothetical protein
MAKNIPVVRNAVLLDPDNTCPSIEMDTPAWFAWLDAPTTSRFSYAMHNRRLGYIDGFLTVRKERRQRGGAYWSVYRRQGKRLRKIYVGSADALTRDRLDQIVACLRQPEQL